jgi:hypothetical protein
MVAPEINLQLSGAKTMSKEQKNIKMNKKKPAMTHSDQTA